ncbi:hypothetical protein B0H16DRAFT_1468443 [Mycena metata]|uniref:Uncharacterized protein n=1 Tax=Mycena metata TaxID=1033252 RepID=A0AAD7I1W0_9AGAR|nr:hypothetical protein B0H16DRAFT_1468443 [Mycena metata]
MIPRHSLSIFRQQLWQFNLRREHGNRSGGCSTYGINLPNQSRLKLKGSSSLQLCITSLPISIISVNLTLVFFHSTKKKQKMYGLTIVPSCREATVTGNGGVVALPILWSVTVTVGDQAKFGWEDSNLVIYLLLQYAGISIFEEKKVCGPTRARGDLIYATSGTSYTLSAREHASQDQRERQYTLCSRLLSTATHTAPFGPGSATPSAAFLALTEIGRRCIALCTSLIPHKACWAALLALSSDLTQSPHTVDRAAGVLARTGFPPLQISRLPPRVSNGRRSPTHVLCPHLGLTRFVSGWTALNAGKKSAVPLQQLLFTCKSFTPKVINCFGDSGREQRCAKCDTFTSRSISELIAHLGPMHYLQEIIYDVLDVPIYPFPPRGAAEWERWIINSQVLEARRQPSANNTPVESSLPPPAPPSNGSSHPESTAQELLFSLGSPRLSQAQPGPSASANLQSSQPESRRAARFQPYPPSLPVPLHSRDSRSPQAPRSLQREQCETNPVLNLEKSLSADPSQPSHKSPRVRTPQHDARVVESSREAPLPSQKSYALKSMPTQSSQLR